MINDVKDFHLPRYEELPDLEIYMDQVLQLLNKYIDPIVQTDITKTMINNYVKKGVVNPPIKKKYTKEIDEFIEQSCREHEEYMKQHPHDKSLEELLLSPEELPFE